MRLLFLFPAVLGGLVCAAPAHAGGSESGGFGISLTVPAICDIEANDFFLDPNSGTLVGQVAESCNSGRGFQILASHRPLGEDEAVEVSYGTQQATLDDSGLSPIAFRYGARHGMVPVSITPIVLAEAINVSFSLTAV